MKRALITTTLLVAFVTQQQAAAESLPQRKAGLWEVTISASGRPGQTIRQCIDSSTDAKMMQMGGDMSAKLGSQCKSTGVQKDGEKYVSESTCNIGGSKIVSKSVFTGDFTAQYSGETTATYDPPMMGMSNMSSVITAKWIGACESGQVPGDMIMPGGMKLNINSLNKMPMPGVVPQGVH